MWFKFVWFTQGSHAIMSFQAIKWWEYCCNNVLCCLRVSLYINQFCAQRTKHPVNGRQLHFADMIRTHYDHTLELYIFFLNSTYSCGQASADCTVRRKSGAAFVQLLMLLYTVSLRRKDLEFIVQVPKLIVFFFPFYLQTFARARELEVGSLSRWVLLLAPDGSLSSELPPSGLSLLLVVVFAPEGLR